jgi:hypothetical protein
MTKAVKQVELMRELVAKHGRRPETVCPLYAKAERDGIVQRKSNRHEISPEQYAYRLYRDGERKGWL